MEIALIPDIIKNDISSLPNPTLFGSRAMASRPATESFDPSVVICSQITKETDWDFSQQYTVGTHRYLVSAGFQCFTAKELDGYADDLTQAVYIKQYVKDSSFLKLPLFDNIVTVNVVLHSDEALFRQVWGSINAEFYYTYLWKRSPSYDHIDDTYEIKARIKSIMNQLYRTGSAFV